jgi:hypothetical protein
MPKVVQTGGPTATGPVPKVRHGAEYLSRSLGGRIWNGLERSCSGSLSLFPQTVWGQGCRHQQPQDGWGREPSSQGWSLGP